ncbi:rhodanese-like domain-containing protein [Rubritalea sp.]|uniref:rhodanese-like domain-containing protein n=1 Tax=Rubritalea sp. TaxID=2109375 RepID=UPI003EF110B8
MKFFVSSLIVATLASCSSHSDSDLTEPVVSAQSATEEFTQLDIKKEEQGFDESLITKVEVERVFELRESGKVYLIDTRPSLFFLRGHIFGAESLPLKHFDTMYLEKESEIKQAVSEGKKIVIYCASEKCPDSYEMATRFAKKGISSSVFKGGWSLWKQTGLE